MTPFIRAAALAVAVLLAAPTTPAVAADTGWAPVPCATGAITEHSGYLDAGGVAMVSTAGWIQPCAATVFTTGFGVAAYFDRVALLVTKRGAPAAPVRPYRSRTAPTSFLSRMDLTPAGLVPGREELGPLRAVCLAYAHAGRVACVGVQHTGPGQAPAVAPIPTDAPAVVRFIDDSRASVAPGCGNCV